MAPKRLYSILALAVPVVVAGAAWATQAQTSPDKHAAHTQHAAQQPPSTQSANKALVDEIAELRARIAQLEAALARGHAAQGGGAIAPQSPPMPMGGGMQRRMGGMGAMPMQSPQAAGAQGMAGMPMMEGMMGAGGMMEMMMGGRGMQMMGGMGPMGQAAMTSALPGFPGASHIYHIGSTGFFLDHPEHITLTLEQQARLNPLKEAAILEQSTFDRRIGQAEQELWVLTGSDTPDSAKIEAKVREIEKLRADQRLAFIRAVGSAATVLTDEQRKQLTGTLPPDSAMPMQPHDPGMSGMSDDM